MRMWFDVCSNTIVTEEELEKDFTEWVESNLESNYPLHDFSFQYDFDDYLYMVDDHRLMEITNADRFMPREA